MNLNNLKNEILLVPKKSPIFIYVGVGTAAGLINSAGELEPTNYHQFPPFLQDLRNRIPELNLFLVLIDPIQENPPYLLRDYPLQEVRKDEYKLLSSANLIAENQGSLNAFIFRQEVHTDPYLSEAAPAGLNITASLKKLNEFAIMNRASLLYHDFTGKRTATLAEHFEYDFDNEHLDQIVYGLSAREDHGCYFDLTSPTSYFPIKIETRLNERPLIKMFNYYKFFANNSLESINSERVKYSTEMQPLIILQKKQIVLDISNRFKTNYMAVLRQLQKIIISPPGEIKAPSICLFDDFPKASRDVYLNLLEKKEYDLLRDIFLEFCIHQLDLIVHLNQLDLSGQDMMKFITADEDPYKWNNNIKLFF
jgi:hypothetical protein